MALYRQRRNGMVLIVVLVVVVMISLAGFSFSEWMFLERKAVYLRGEELQVQYVAESGQQLLETFAAQPRKVRRTAGGVYDNPGLFRGVVVLDDGPGGRRARFSVVNPLSAAQRGEQVRFGLEDESARLNLAVLTRWEQSHPGSAQRALLNLPGMTIQVADAILDWIDPDDQPRPFGAEADFYEGLDPSYAPRNGTPELIEELLLVKGVTRELLFGRDTTTVIIGGDPEDARSVAPRPSSPGRFQMEPQRPWAALLTLYSAERNVTLDGVPRINLNDTDLANLRQRLVPVFDPDWVEFIIAYRQFGPYRGDRPAGQSSRPDFDPTRPGNFTIASVLDLIGAKVEVPGRNDDDKSVIVASPFRNDRSAMQQYLLRLMDTVCTGPWKRLEGTINVNRADEAVLRSVPGMDSVTATRILESRQNSGLVVDDLARAQVAWLLLEDVVSLPQLKALLPYLTAGGDVFRGEVVGYFDGRGPTARLELVVDATYDPPRQVYRKDLRLLGPGYQLDKIGAESTESTDTATEAAEAASQPLGESR